MQSPFQNIPPVVKNLLMINIICFLPFIFFSEAQYSNLAVSHFALFYFGSPFFKPWQIVTYMFLHGGWSHILFNMFALFSFGPILEYTVGSKKFFNLYFISGIGAALFQLLVMAIEMYHYTGQFVVPMDYNADATTIAKISAIYSGPILGASGAIFGVLVAFGMLYPNMELMILFIPVPVKAKYIIPVYVVIELFLGFGQFAGDNVAHFAHIGGALVGYLVVKAWGINKNNNTYR
jgi:membrane associated rhomboid family serine protease